MVPYHGDYDTTETVAIPFNTFTSDDPSASATITNLAAADIHIHKDGGLTQRSSSAGVTVSVDFDGITGNHLVTIDLSDNTDAGFYAAGSRYQVRMEGTTVDGATINAWIGTFSIGTTLRPATAGRTLGVDANDRIDVGSWLGTAVTLGNGAPDVNIQSTDDIDLSATQKASVNTEADTALTDMFTSSAALVDAIWDEAVSAHNTGGSFGAFIRVIKDGMFIREGTAQAGANGTITLDASASAVDDFYNHTLILLVGGTGAGQVRLLTDYTGSTKVASVGRNWTTNPDNTTEFQIVVFAEVAAKSVLDAVTVGTNNDKTGYRLSATGIDDVLDEAYEGTTTLRQFLRLAASALFGRLSGAATSNIKIRDEADSKDRIDATVDADGNRTAVTLDKS